MTVRETKKFGSISKYQTLTQEQNTSLQHILTISSLSLPPNTKKLTLTLTTTILTHIWKTRNKLQFDATIISATKRDHKYQKRTEKHYINTL